MCSSAFYAVLRLLFQLLESGLRWQRVWMPQWQCVNKLLLAECCLVCVCRGRRRQTSHICPKGGGVAAAVGSLAAEGVFTDLCFIMRSWCNDMITWIARFGKYACATDMFEYSIPLF